MSQEGTIFVALGLVMAAVAGVAALIGLSDSLGFPLPARVVGATGAVGCAVACVFFLYSGLRRRP